MNVAGGTHLLVTRPALPKALFWALRIRVHSCPFVVELNSYGAAASTTGAHAGESPAGRIGRFTTDSPMPVPPRGWEGKAVGELNRQAVMKMNHIQ